MGKDRDAEHRVTLHDGKFAHAACSCGWRGDGRRSRKKMKADAAGHASKVGGTVVKS